MRVQVKDFMSSPVKTAVGENTVKEVRDMMKKNGIHSVPIIQYVKQLPNAEVTIQGIITASDVDSDVDDNVLVSEVMSTNVHVIHKDSSAKAAANMMLKHKVHHLVVMEAGRIIGMISSMDFVELVAEHTLD